MAPLTPPSEPPLLMALLLLTLCGMLLPLPLLLNPALEA